MSFSAKSIYTWYRTTIRNPKYRWWVILGTLAYLLSPIDFAPDFLPIVGQLDDIAILTLLVSEISQMMGERIKSRRNNNLEHESTSGKETTVDVNAASVE